jgi:hypothetical protein
MSDKGLLVIFAVIAYLLWRHAQMSGASTKQAAGVATGTYFTPATGLRATAAGNMIGGGPTKPFNGLGF